MVFTLDKEDKQYTPQKLFFHNIMKKAKQHWFATIVIISAVIMIVVHILFKVHLSYDFFVAEWSAGDLLLYLGAIIGAVATIYVLQETIKSTINQQREERSYIEHKQKEDKAFSIRPYFLITAKELKAENEDIIEIPNSFIDREWAGNINVLVSIENVGAGNAVDVYAKISQNDNNEIIVPIPALIVGRVQFLLIKQCLPQKLQFEIEYSDIACIGTYVAQTSISIIRGSSNVGIKSERVTIKTKDTTI